MSYQDMVSRNWAFISSDVQERIKNSTILLAGCGLGSNIAVLAAQTGFCHFIGVDYDRVELSNLNRQAFTYEHVGQSKAEALGEIVCIKSPYAKFEAHSTKLTLENVEEFVAQADFIVNTVDFDETTFAINDIALAQGKTVFMPMNIGYGGFCMVFTENSATLDDMLGSRDIVDDVSFIQDFLGASKGFSFPEEISSALPNLIKDVEGGMPYPQIGVAAARSASLTVEAIISVLKGRLSRVAPNAICMTTL